MKSVSLNLLAAAVLAVFFVLSTTTGAVVGTKATSSDEEMAIAMEYKMRAEQNYIKNGNEKREMIMNMMRQQLNAQELLARMSLSSSPPEKALTCVAAGGYCNIVFGPRCCTNDFACVPPGLVGGVCVA